MELNFDIRGNLKPTEIIEISMDTFQQTFVNAFKEESIRQQLFAFYEKYKVDAYIVANYPENHKNHIFTKSDLLYWRSLFGKTRVNRAKKQYGKGLIQLNFVKDE